MGNHRIIATTEEQEQGEDLLYPTAMMMLGMDGLHVEGCWGWMDGHPTAMMIFLFA